MTYGEKEFILAYDSRGKVQNGRSGLIAGAWDREPREYIFPCEHQAQRSNWKWGKALNSQRLMHDSCLFFSLCHFLFLSHFILLLSLNEFLTFISLIKYRQTWYVRESMRYLSCIIWLHFAQHDL